MQSSPQDVGEIMGYLGGFFLFFVLTPQVYTTYSTKNAQGLSPWFLLFQLLASACFIAYGYLLPNNSGIPVIVSNSSALVSTSLLIYARMTFHSAPIQDQQAEQNSIAGTNDAMFRGGKSNESSFLVSVQQQQHTHGTNHKTNHVSYDSIASDETGVFQGVKSKRSSSLLTDQQFNGTNDVSYNSIEGCSGVFEGLKSKV
jgi:uncharacterized protein with PQ loop repeat